MAEPSISGFGEFLVERQAIWHRREVLREPAPWTDDPVLRSRRFCNVQRDLDRGTLVLKRALREHWMAPTREQLVNVVAYRQLNRYDVWADVVGWLQPTARAVHEAHARLRDAKASGRKIGPLAWMPTAGTVEGNVARAALGALANIELLVDVCRHEVSLENVHAELGRNVPGMGGMVGFQVALDLTYVYPNLSEDEWVFLYGGRATGSGWTAHRLFPGLPTLEACRRLRDTQHLWLLGAEAGRGERWGDVAWAGKPRLTLADVEHSLCEYRKYLSGRTKRKFDGGGVRGA